MDAYNNIRRAIVQLSLHAQEFHDDMTATDSDYDRIRTVYLTLSRAHTYLEANYAVANIVQAAKDAEFNQTYDFATEYTAFIAKVADPISWIELNVPNSGTMDAPQNWEEGKTMLSTTFTPTTLTALRNKMLVIIAGVEV